MMDSNKYVIQIGFSHFNILLSTSIWEEVNWKKVSPSIWQKIQSVKRNTFQPDFTSDNSPQFHKVDEKLQTVANQKHQNWKNLL